MIALAICLARGWLLRGSPRRPPPGKWTPLETLKYRLVSDVQVSPDGRTVAYVVRDSIMEADKSEYRTQIWLSSRQATFADQSSSRPRWSPDGKWLALLSKRGDKNANVWLLPTAGGEAWRLTDAPADVQQFAWSPDGKWIAFVELEPPREDRERRERERDDARVVDEEDRPGRLSVISVPAEAGGRPRGTAAALAALGRRESRSRGARTRSTGRPTGRRSPFRTRRVPSPTSGRAPTSRSSTSPRAPCGPLAATGAAETTPRFSPDGRWIAYVASDDPPRWAHQRGIRLAPAERQAPRATLPPSFDESPELAGWSADGRRSTSPKPGASTTSSTRRT